MNKYLKKWGEKVVYQIFPRSFSDFDNDGNGDIKGIISKLDYLQDLGIDAIWLCPVYKTEFADAGYDVLDYKEIWKTFGTLDDFKLLVQESKKRNIEIIMDIVLNHTSNKHQWFLKAIESEKNKEYNYYIWTDKPGNEQSIFGGSAWEYVPSLKKYYFHLFAKEQVDLNWGSDFTINAMADVIDFWYKLGVKGFRLDAIQHVHKEINENGQFTHSFGSQMVNYLQKFLNKIYEDKQDIFLIGEASGIQPNTVVQYGKGEQKIADNFYNFSLWYIGWGRETGRNGYDANWSIKQFANQGAIEYQNNEEIENHMISNFLSSHDTSRAISRWGDEKLYWNESAKSLALYQFSLKGIQTILYGEEIGLKNPIFLNREEFKDVDALNSYRIFVDEKKIYSEQEMTRFHNINGRDHARVPMVWNKTINYGFNKGTQPWIKMSGDYLNSSVQEQENDKESILHFYKKLIKTRKKYKNLLIEGKSKLEILENEIIKITRYDDQNTIISLINLTKHEKEILNFSYHKIIMSTYTDGKEFKGTLRPYESFMFLVK
ncbi:alpha-amylase family glycosyl hydrolase [Mesomycoplasma lagogenitalium]|uniref:Alpha-amylase family glycosyl hydrolase n=1 Tax=Mesomycoplasma lagogenitalium TaxID=171286 RepID=A0ABY8LU35_9BACT|nr:alpha-amylase family glycosyl hydrolase [Mesomycoplasma lagogenitalium]WGI36752.1 alpha-amylase family glycosyl hydrolase [Mesomycoplasma lagogenitalium]